ncbi:hypothetical protein Aperf_G00000083170 [Anoplocephala perfoliata]
MAFRRLKEHLKRKRYQGKMKRKHNNVSPHNCTPKEEEPNYVSAYALYTYSQESNDECSFIAGDVLTVLQLEGEWWLAKNCRTGQKGLIPSNYVTTNKSEAIVLEGWFDVDRFGAEQKLLMPGVETGMYIIRPGKGANFPYSLSVRGQNSNIPHFQVGFNQLNKCFYLTPSISFSTVNDLLNYYKSTTLDGYLGLTEPRPPRVNPPLDLNDCKIDLNNLQFMERIGVGNFGEVYKAKVGNVLIAVKKSKGEQGREAFIQEAKTMLMLKHPSIVQFMGIAEEVDGKSVIIMLEYMANGSLRSYFQKRGKSAFKYRDLIQMIDTLAQGMIYLESVNVVHMDLRTDNVLVNGEGKVKIADFGLTRILGAGMNFNSDKFPIRWTAPEIMRGSATHTTKCDVWSFGVLMFEILTCGMQPYAELKTPDDVRKNVLAGVRLPSPTKYGFECHEAIYSAMKACWNVDPNQRPTFREIYRWTQEGVIEEVGYYGNAAELDRD